MIIQRVIVLVLIAAHLAACAAPKTLRVEGMSPTQQARVIRPGDRILVREAGELFLFTVASVKPEHVLASPPQGAVRLIDYA